MLASWQMWKCLKKRDALCCVGSLVVWMPSTLPWTCSWGFSIFVFIILIFCCYINSACPSRFWFPLSASSSWCPVILVIQVSLCTSFFMYAQWKFASTPFLSLHVVTLKTQDFHEAWYWGVLLKVGIMFPF